MPQSIDFESEEQLVARIKQMQKSDPVGREQWNAFADSNGGGKRDPAKHAADTLRNFLKGYMSGVRVQTEEEMLNIPQVTKLLQKRVSAFKDLWSQFCSLHGGGKSDPLRHEPSFHIQFFEQLAKSAMGKGPPNLTGMGTGMDGPPNLMSRGKGMGMGMDAGPPMKRMKGGSGMPFGTAALGDPASAALVNCIKAYQRQGEEQKQAWAVYCDQDLGGVRDPARHDMATLQRFVDAYGLEVGASETPAFGGMPATNQWQNHGVNQWENSVMAPAQNMNHWDSSGMAPAPNAFQWDAAGMAPDSIKSQLVQRIKNYQKQGEAEKQLWSGYCGATKDPALHEVTKLQDFVNMFGVP